MTFQSSVIFMLTWRYVVKFHQAFYPTSQIESGLPTGPGGHSAWLISLGSI